MTFDQLSIFDALAALQPTVVATLEPEPGWVWARCPTCSEVRYQKRTGATKTKCVLTPTCPGRMDIYLDVLCAVCGKPVTARRRNADIRFCSKKCEVAQ